MSAKACSPSLGHGVCRWLLVLLGSAVLAACTEDTPESERPTVAPAAESAPSSEGISFRLDESAYRASQPVAWPVPFDVVAADMELDGDADLLVNWHNLAPLELFENVGDGFVLRNPESDDRSGLYENPGIPSLYAVADEMLTRIRSAADQRPGVFVWHDPSRREDWHLRILVADEPVQLRVRGNRPLTLKGGRRFLQGVSEFESEYIIDADAYFRVKVGYVSTQFTVSSTVPVYVGPDMVSMGSGEVTLWKDDPHGMAWIDVRGTPEPDLLLTRGGMMGTLQPPHDPKIDRFFEYAPGEFIYEDVRMELPTGFGRGRRVEWVDIDGDMVSELYIGNTDTANALLVADGPHGYRDIATDVGLDFREGDTFAWIDVDGSGLDDLVFIDGQGFGVAYNHGEMTFDVQPGDDIGLVFPAGSPPDHEDLFATLSLSVLDFDNDGQLDIWLVGHGAERQHALYRGTGARFVDVTTTVGLGDLPPTHGYVMLDADNDGFVDVVTIGPSSWLLHNDTGTRFVRHPFGAEWDLRQYTRAVALDVGGDSRLDIALIGERRLLARNTTLTSGHALWVKVAADRDPIGTLVTARYADGTARRQRFGSAGSTQYSQGSLPLHFGVPPGNLIVELTVRWPDGRNERRTVQPEERFVEFRR